VLRIILPILMLPIEVFSHLARVMSLTVRLFANMFAGEMVTLVFFSLIPLGIPLVFEGLHIGVSVIQTYILCCWRRRIWARLHRTHIKEGLRLRCQVSGKSTANSAEDFPET